MIRLLLQRWITPIKFGLDCWNVSFVYQCRFQWYPLCLSPSSTIFRHSQTLVFQCALLAAVAGASHLICHLLLYDNWSNWTFCPRNVTGNLVAISPGQPHGGHISGTLGGKWRAGISFIEKPRWLAGILTSHPPLDLPEHLRC